MRSNARDRSHSSRCWSFSGSVRSTTTWLSRKRRCRMVGGGLRRGFNAPARRGAGAAGCTVARPSTTSRGVVRRRGASNDCPEQLVATEPVHVDARPLDDALEQLAFVHQSVADPLLYPKPVAQSHGL